MKRIHLMEFHDQDWFPGSIRDAATDYLRFSIAATKAYDPVAEVLAGALKKTGDTQIVDLCSGGAGPWFSLQPALARLGAPVTISLTDRFPNIAAFTDLNRTSHNAITFHPEPVDAAEVPAELTGFRTLFSSFHHFAPEQAIGLLRNAIVQRRGIGIFEATQRHPKALLAMLLAPLAVLVLVPFIRPFKWSRLLWTYVIPFLPLITVFDGLVSCLRTYSPEELRDLTEALGGNDYEWEIGTKKNARLPNSITYLIGTPPK